MVLGVLNGLCWALATTLLGVVLEINPFITLAAAPLLTSIFNDFFTFFWMNIYLAIKKKTKFFYKELFQKKSISIIIAGLLGGTIGMILYVYAISLIGPGLTAMLSSLYPLIGALLSFLFLKEKINLRQIIALVISLLAIAILAYSPSSSFSIFGIFLALLAALCWALEAFIISYVGTKREIDPEISYAIKTTVSSITHLIIILPLITGFSEAFIIISDINVLLLALSAILTVLSYVLYYYVILKIGANKAMALNITYVAWATLFNFILYKDTFSFKTLFLAIIILSSSIYSSIETKKPLSLHN